MSKLSESLILFFWPCSRSQYVRIELLFRTTKFQFEVSICRKGKSASHFLFKMDEKEWSIDENRTFLGGLHVATTDENMSVVSRNHTMHLFMIFGIVLLPKGKSLFCYRSYLDF